MTGEGAPFAPDEGASLIDAACARGSAEAALMLATIEAMGAGRPQNWQRAFDYLQLAAERGSADAQAQLLLLAREAGPVGPDSWKQLRAGLDLAALTTSPPRRSLSEDPRVRVVEGFASADECDWVMKATREGLRPARVLDRATGEERHDPTRTNRAIELKLAEMDLVLQVIRARIASATNLPVPVFEPVQVMHYAVGQEFRPHYDFLNPEEEEGYTTQLARFGQRIATFLLYLNDDFEGGETAFPAAGLSYRGSKGDALFFANVDRSNAPDPLTLHAGLPPTRGEKWILSQWIRDRSPALPAA